MADPTDPLDTRLFVIRVTEKCDTGKGPVVGYAVAERVTLIYATPDRALHPDDLRLQKLTIDGLDLLFENAGDAIMEALPLPSRIDPNGGGYAMFGATHPKQ